MHIRTGTAKILFCICSEEQTAGVADTSKGRLKGHIGTRSLQYPTCLHPTVCSPQFQAVQTLAAALRRAAGVFPKVRRSPAAQLLAMQRHGVTKVADIEWQEFQKWLQAKLDRKFEEQEARIKEFLDNTMSRSWQLEDARTRAISEVSARRSDFEHTAVDMSLSASV